MSQRQMLPLLVALLVILSPACFVRKRTLPVPASHLNRPLLKATKDELVQRIHNLFDPIHSFLMRAELSPSVIGPVRESVTDYATVGAFIVFRRPDQLRIIGQDPVIESTIFDMVSGGNEFHLYLPRRKRLIKGRNDVAGTSGNKFENLRPTAFLTALMIYPPDPENEIALLEDDTSDTKAVYILLIVRRNKDHFWLARNVYFDRYTLEITRQKTFDQSGNIVSETRYSGWTKYGDITFPSDIDILRPQDNYEVQLRVISIRFNTPDITPEKFVLNPPQGVEVRELK